MEINSGISWKGLLRPASRMHCMPIDPSKESRMPVLACAFATSPVFKNNPTELFSPTLPGFFCTQLNIIVFLRIYPSCMGGNYTQFFLKQF